MRDFFVASFIELKGKIPHPNSYNRGPTQLHDQKKPTIEYGLLSSPPLKEVLLKIQLEHLT